MPAADWTTLLARTHRNCSACANCPHTSTTAVPPSGVRSWIPAVSGTVWALGFTSLFTDISSEMVASILPMYLVLQVGLNPLMFGFVDGVYQGAAALVRVAAGALGDRWRRHKELAAVGYGMSAACRLAILAAGTGWSALAGVVMADRIGKGIRTAPRDALISLRSPCRELATAFGVHRSLDAAGAMLGPVAAFVLLAMMPGAYDVLFVVSFAVAVVGLGVILFFVDGQAATRAIATMRPAAPAVSLLAAPRFRAILVAGLLLSVPTMSDSFIFLALQRRLQIPAMAFPLFYVVTSLFMSMLSVPLGRAADRFGRSRVLLGGYGLLVLVYACLFVPAGAQIAALVPLALLGAYYAATDGVLTAMAATVLPAESSGSGLGVLATATNAGRFVASVVFGFLWMRLSLATATGIFLAGLVLAIVVAGVVLLRAEPDAHNASPAVS